jgi:NAD(P)-dependent dehydrogenase (short-subunit alcohol dehydrogenase family)
VELGICGRTAFVTGGASGIGLACAIRLNAEGARVVIADKYDRVDEVARTHGFEGHRLDVTDAAAVEGLADRIRANGMVPSILITCAGVLQRPLPPSELSWKEWDLVQSIHVRGTYACCRAFGSMMAESGAGGAIVTISSVAGLRSTPLHSYGPAKAAIVSLTQTLAAEWGRFGVRVNSVAPGFTQTPALERGFDTATLSRRRLEETSALGRLVKADEIAAAALYLVSDMASAVTGVVLPVDAGFLVASDWRAYERAEEQT